MANIQVIFPKGQPVIVTHEGEIVPRGEVVTWSFHTDDPAIRFVEVEFSSPKTDTFFPNNGTTHRFRKEVVDGRADIYGHGPHYPRKAHPIIAKYTVRGLDGKGNPVDPLNTVRDPVIITPKP